MGLRVYQCRVGEHRRDGVKESDLGWQTTRAEQYLSEVIQNK